MIRSRDNRTGKIQPLAATPQRIDVEGFVMEVLTFFAANPSETGRFLDWSGLEARDLRGAAASEGFAMGLLDYFSQHLPGLDRLCAANSLDPADVLRLHASLRVHGLTSHDEL